MKSFRRCCLGLLLPAVLLALPACQRPEEPLRPADLLTKEQLVPIIADLHVLEARVEGSRLLPDSSRALYLAQQKSMLLKRGVTGSAFQRSYRYYSIHGKDLDEIYGAVIDTLGRREARFAPAGKPVPATPGQPPK